jgi:hypothetical protein
MNNGQTKAALELEPDEWVIVRSKEEILMTLDNNGRLEELPFMPQMLEFCGRRLQVHRHVHKLCGAGRLRGNRMLNTVNLKGVRCDGKTYGGCEMQCMILWKEAWLKRDERAHSVARDVQSDYKVGIEASGCSESDVWKGTQAEPDDVTGEPVYVCQATQLPKAAQPLSIWAIKPYLEDYVFGYVSLQRIFWQILFKIYHEVLVQSGIGLGSFFRAIYDVIQFVRGGRAYPWHTGKVPKKERTPAGNLNLEVGEVVRIKEYKQILHTLDENRKNRGLHFHAELTLHCGKTFRVLHRPKKVMDESTGRLMELKNDCIVLDGADCDGKYTNPLNCTRATYPWYREVWLERVPQEPIDNRFVLK